MSMKILHIIPSLSKGGAERLVLTICKELLCRTDIDVKIVVFSDTHEYTNFAGLCEIHVIPAKFVPSVFKKPQKEVAALQSFIDEYEPHIIHTHLWQAEMVCSQINYQQATWVTHLHDNMVQLKKRIIPANKLQLTNILERAIVTRQYKLRKTQFISISHDTHRYAQKNVPKSLIHNVHLLPNAIDVSYFYKEKESKLYSNQLTLVTVGSLVHKKNQEFLIPVVARLHDMGFPTFLHILGDGKNKRHIQQAIKRHSLESYVILHGNVDVLPFYHSADMYVHAATYEPFGLVFIEAMAAGLPVVCINGKGNKDIIEHGKNGFIFDDLNYDEFAQTIADLWRSPKRYEQISNYALHTAQTYNIASYINSLLRIYSHA